MAKPQIPLSKNRNRLGTALNYSQEMGPSDTSKMEVK
eukprot:gene11722-20102_t